jgi:hypothetical protein
MASSVIDVQKTAQMIKFEQIASFYEISDYFAQKLLQLKGFDIVIINDDSYSMDTSLKTGGTRWDEQKNMAKIVTDIAATMDPDGIDHYFLNKGKFPNIMDAQQVESLFTGTCGGTPLCRTLRQVLADKRGILVQKKLLIIIITDGRPESIADFKSILANERVPAGQVYTTIVACTDEESTMDYLNGWDQSIKRLDVVDDYQSEKVEVLKKQGQDFPFSFGDYVVKTLLGSIDQHIDKLDEVKISDMHLLPPELEEVQITPVTTQSGSRQVPLNDPIGHSAQNRAPVPAKVQSCCVIC